MKLTANETYSLSLSREEMGFIADVMFRFTDGSHLVLPWNTGNEYELTQRAREIAVEVYEAINEYDGSDLEDWFEVVAEEDRNNV